MTGFTPAGAYMLFILSAWMPCRYRQPAANSKERLSLRSRMQACTAVTYPLPTCLSA